MKLLSICIPTFNRCELLGRLLEQLKIEAAPVWNEVEIVVSDNCSTDETFEVCGRFLDLIVYHRNNTNIGAARNMVNLVRSLANGQYCLVIGDDDAFEVGALRFIVDILKSNSGVKYFFLNHTYMPMHDRVRVMGGKSHELGLRVLCDDRENKMIEKWEYIIRTCNFAGLYTSIVSHLAHRDLWKSGDIDLTSGHDFDAFDTTFPHLKILADQVLGRSVGYIGLPLIHLGIGAQEWFSDHWKKILSTHVLEFARRMMENGCEKALIDRYVNLISIEIGNVNTINSQ